MNSNINSTNDNNTENCIDINFDSKIHNKKVKDNNTNNNNNDRNDDNIHFLLLQ